MSVTRRFFTASGIAALGVTLAGCDDEETTRRKAFIRFLQTRVIDQPTLRFPVVQDEEYAAFGHYLTHYHVMRRFHNALNGSISKPLQQALKAGNVNTFQELVSRRDDIAVARDGMLRVRDTLDKAEAEADADRAKLTQTKDLETVYAQAYEKLVSRPARVIRGAVPPIEGTLQAGLDLADYLIANRTAIRVRGGQLESDDVEIRRRLAPLLQAMIDRSEGLSAAEQQLRQLAAG